MKQTIYIVRPIKEKLPPIGKHLVIAKEWEELPFEARWNGHRWDDTTMMNDFDDMVTHWLEPLEVDIPKMVEEAFDAGADNMHYVHLQAAGNTLAEQYKSPSKTDYLKQVKDKL